MTVTMIDSVVYGGLWRPARLAALFDETARTRAWLEILAVLAETEAELAVIPAPAAAEVARTCRGAGLTVDAAFLEELRAGREETGHSTAGLIRAVARRCAGDAGEWVGYGAAVQDISDTWLMTALRDARAFFGEELAGLDETLTGLAARHRDTPMLGRTHAQAGLPITFGFKVAGWAAEVRRHRRRLEELGGRMDVGQLGGGVGSLSGLGPRALLLQTRFCERLGLRAPVVSWTSSRDVLAEWGTVLALVAGTADRVGHEVVSLQRGEIGELDEGGPASVLGSVTMPHKRNPEVGEHLGTLARIVRHLAACLLEGTVHEHERDGRAWKVEWHVVPELTLMAGRAVELFRGLAVGLVVHVDRMRQNLDATGGSVLSEALMLTLAPHLGRESAYRLVYGAAQAARARGQAFEAVARASPEIAAHLTPGELDEIFDVSRHTGQCAALVDRLLADVT